MQHDRKAQKVSERLENNKKLYFDLPQVEGDMGSEVDFTFFLLLLIE